MRLGASEMLEKPLDTERLTRPGRHESCGERKMADRDAIGALVDRAAIDTGEGCGPRVTSAAERLAALILKACCAEGDVRTLADWSESAGSSVSSLSEACRLLNIRPRDARDFARVLRVVLYSNSWNASPQSLFDVADRRTLNLLLQRAGVTNASELSRLEPSDFMRRQRFIEQGHDVLSVLRECLNPMN